MLPELRQPQHDGHRGVQLVAGDFQEDPLEAVGLHQLGVGGLELGQQPVLFDDQVVPLHGLTNDGFQLFRLPGLGDVAEDMALIDRVDDGVDVGVSGEQQPGRLRADRLAWWRTSTPVMPGIRWSDRITATSGVGLEVLDGLGPLWQVTTWYSIRSRSWTE